MNELLARPELPLLIGTVLALGALAFVLFPIFDDSPRAPERPRARGVRSRTEPRQAAVDALREIEFDRETGKLSDSDYAALKARYTERALSAMRAEDASAAAGPSSGIDAAEAAIRKYREAPSCSTCGPRPEPDAVFCSDCGRYLPGECEACGAAVDALGARFCGVCGHSLAA